MVLLILKMVPKSKKNIALKGKKTPQRNNTCFESKSNYADAQMIIKKSVRYNTRVKNVSISNTLFKKTTTKMHYTSLKHFINSIVFYFGKI